MPRSSWAAQFMGSTLSPCYPRLGLKQTGKGQLHPVHPMTPHNFQFPRSKSPATKKSGHSPALAGFTKSFGALNQRRVPKSHLCSKELRSLNLGLLLYPQLPAALLSIQKPQGFPALSSAGFLGSPNSSKIIPHLPFSLLPSIQ